LQNDVQIPVTLNVESAESPESAPMQTQSGVCKYYIGPISDLSLLTATAAAAAAARVQFALSH